LEGSLALILGLGVEWQACFYGFSRLVPSCHFLDNLKKNDRSFLI
jgi:hypothetical protein